MASYMHNPMFGQTDPYSLSSSVGFNYAAGGTDYPGNAAYLPGVSSGDSGGSGETAGWLNLGAGILGLGTSIVNAAAGQTSPTAQTYVPPRTVVPATGTSTTTLLLLGALAIGAIVLMK